MIRWLLVLVLGSAAGVPAALHAADAGPGSNSTLAGAWTGHWAAKDSAATGPLEVLIADGAARGPILAQFTFVHQGGIELARAR